MAQSNLQIDVTTTFVTIEETNPTLDVVQVSANLVTGTSGPQGPQGIQGEQGPAGEDTTELIENHIIDTTPHPAYDDLTSLTLLFENGLV